MKIKTISDDEWNELYVKPFISVGFHKYKTGCAIIAICDEGICQCHLIEESHLARQNAFLCFKQIYTDAPIAIFNNKTESFLASILDNNTSLKLLLKGPCQNLQKWQMELSDYLENGRNTKISEDNPLQLSAFQF